MKGTGPEKSSEQLYETCTSVQERFQKRSSTMPEGDSRIRLKLMLGDSTSSTLTLTGRRGSSPQNGST
jgi:hypothetical protein